MTDHYIAPRRTVQLHAPVSQPDAAEETLQNNDLQQDAGVFSGTQKQPLPSPEDYTISVEQVREHFRSKGLRKSKDTVQRWCRTGELTCQKRGVLGRYFTTEASLLELERKLLPDMIAENVGVASPTRPDLQPHAAVDADEQTGMQAHEAADTAADSSTQPDMQLHATERSGAVNTDVARLTAEVAGLQAQLDNRDKQIEFLQEEIRSGREQRSAVVQISNRMLETLETMAVGGRLERPRQQGRGPEQSPEPVQGEYREAEAGRV